MRLSTNFSLPEFASKDGSDFPEDVKINLAELAKNLQVLRDHFGRSVTITSGYRSASHNVRIGGARDSYHVRGMAADIQISGITPKQVYDAIEALIKEGKMKEGGLGLYDSWTHYDHRGKRIRWDKSTKNK
jgi:uncharacterized protein YcbK (DUF882 family)